MFKNRLRFRVWLLPTGLLLSKALESVLLCMEPAFAHWCHECGSQTTVVHTVGSAHGDLVCADCGGGFIETMESARALGHVRRSVRRRESMRQRRFHIHSAALRRLEATISEADLNSPTVRQEVRRLVHMMDLLPSRLQSSGLHEFTTGDVIDETHDRDFSSRETELADHALPVHGMPWNSRIIQNELGADDERIDRVPLDGGTSPGDDEDEFFVVNASNENIRYANDMQVETGHADAGFNLRERTRDLELSIVRSGQEGTGQNSVSPENPHEEGSVHSQVSIVGVDEVSDTDVEVRVLELSDWDSLDEDDENDWEEIEGVGDEEGQDGGALGHADEVSQATFPLQGGVTWASRTPRSARRRLDAISSSLQNLSAEMELETLNLDTYVGNPEDYVDARNFEELLQQFLDSDSARRGSPPAAKAAIEGLPMVLVQCEDVENGPALCAICKDGIQLNEPVKQLPCSHLYHSECIVPWLTERNTCPVCRYELPTDDPDYEEQRKREKVWQIGRQLVGNNSGESNVTSGVEGEEVITEGNLIRETDDIDTDVLLTDTSMGEVGDNFETRQGNGQSLLRAVAGPLISVVGLVMVSCLGNLLLGSSGQRHHPISNQVGTSREMGSGRSWWATFFR